ncbi:Na/Pi cotransporter [Clostridiales bacterium S5-A14a]|nr:Na/Pi cotransporter [Clostridiales bacterium S5-A14a]
MDVFSFFTLGGGLALFLYGMNVMSQGLSRLAGGRLEIILKRMTATKFHSLFLGLIITAAIQSSSAVTVMLVGLVNSGIMELGQTVGVIMGSNIGTTATAWILSLIGIQGDNFFVKILNPSNFSPVLALMGVIMTMSAKKSKHKDIGTIMVGFAILMFGMGFMSDAVKPLTESPGFAKILVAFNNPFLGILTGFVLTAIIQSSSASVGILQALSLTSSLTYGMAIPIIMGQNIGTCITAIISSIGVSKNAKRVSVIHVLFNLLGTTVCLILFYTAHALFQFPWIESAIGPAGIALSHTVFNVLTTIFLLPFSGKLVLMARKIIRAEGHESSFLDERLFRTPSVAIQECRNKTDEMAKLAFGNVSLAMELIFKYDEDKADELEKTESQIDRFEDKLGSYLVKLSGFELSDTDSRMISTLLHTIGDFERIGDHGVTLLQAAKEIKDKDIVFSDTAMMELEHIKGALDEIISITLAAFVEDNLEKAREVEPLEEVIDDLTDLIKTRHISRLQSGKCTIEHGFVLNDMLISFERISDHCSNVAAALIELENYSFERHKYLRRLKSRDDRNFKALYKEFSEKYGLPA